VWWRRAAGLVWLIGSGILDKKRQAHWWIQPIHPRTARLEAPKPSGSFRAVTAKCYTSAPLRQRQPCTCAWPRARFHLPPNVIKVPTSPRPPTSYRREVRTQRAKLTLKRFPRGGPVPACAALITYSTPAPANSTCYSLCAGIARPSQWLQHASHAPRCCHTASSSARATPSRPHAEIFWKPKVATHCHALLLLADASGTLST